MQVVERMCFNHNKVFVAAIEKMDDMYQRQGFAMNSAKNNAIKLYHSFT